MDFLNRIFGREPATLRPIGISHAAPNWPPLPGTHAYDRYEPTREGTARKIKRLLRAPDPVQVALGRKLRQEVYGPEADKALEDLRNSIGQVRVGPSVAALTLLVIAEEKRVGSVQNSSLFKPHGDGARLGRKVLVQMGRVDCDGWSHLLAPKVRAALATSVNSSPEVTDSLHLLTLGALAHDATKDLAVVRWCIEALAPGDAPQSNSDACKRAAQLLREVLPDIAQKYVQRAELAWDKNEVVNTLNLLRPMAAVGAVRDAQASALVRRAAGPAWGKATQLARRILQVQTASEESMELFRLTRTSAGWSSIVPLIEPMGEPEVQALDRLIPYVGASYIEEDWRRRKALPLLRAVVNAMEAHGYGDRECVADAKATLAWRRSIFDRPDPDPMHIDTGFSENPGMSMSDFTF